LKEAADKFYYSWQTGFIKPDPGAWRNVLEDNNLKPEECIYFDDQDKNLKAAESLGIKAHMFVDAITTKEILKGEIKI
jgi:putative hydrolase of the HAD superfamily